jgi:integrase
MGLAKKLLPHKRYAGAIKDRHTDRYFVDKFPMFYNPAASSPPVVVFRATISITRLWVVGEVGDSKTEGSAKPLPMDSDLAIVLKEHRERNKQYGSQWIFLNPVTGNPFWPSKIRENHLVPAGIAAGIGRVGWQTFRHTYSSLLREHEVDIKVQQALLRHAGIRTTMNIYTQAVPRAVREANR